MDDLSPLHPVLVMLLFWFIMGVIRLDSDCTELLSPEYILPRGGVTTPSLIENISEDSEKLFDLCLKVWRTVSKGARSVALLSGVLVESFASTGGSISSLQKSVVSATSSWQMLAPDKSQKF